MKLIIGDITKIEADAIVNAANGIGTMGGGVAHAIKLAGGDIIEREAIKICNELEPQEGDVYVTSAGNLKAKYVFHAVTMKSPVQPSSLEIVKKCLFSLLKKAREYEIKSMAIPALGTGVGRLSKKDVAEIYKNILEAVRDIEIMVVDRDGEFIKYLKTTE